MTNKQDILLDFIQTFFEKAKTNRRHNKNTILNLTEIINRACKLHLHETFDFKEEEILDGFYENGFSILEPTNRNVNTGRTNKGIVKFSTGNHINVNSQNISDLVSSLRKGFPLKSNPDTILRINKLKESLKLFANKYEKEKVGRV
ncbi:hypothetical protein [Mangrovimonas aestuarii]|uniref:hypothetical protein n=1 Tax=Mangrovimonas aestuarii TaxID=3018443 RepID=UPI0023797BBE|nr:hypothetical protein [Mangrovimonas aestuarii]